MSSRGAKRRGICTSRLILIGLLAVVVSCDVSTRIGGTAPFREYRVVNAYTSPVDILVDGNVVAAALTPGDRTCIRPSHGWAPHSVTSPIRRARTSSTWRARLEAGRSAPGNHLPTPRVGTPRPRRFFSYSPAAKRPRS